MCVAEAARVDILNTSCGVEDLQKYCDSSKALVR